MIPLSLVDSFVSCLLLLVLLVCFSLQYSHCAGVLGVRRGSTATHWVAVVEYAVNTVHLSGGGAGGGLLFAVTVRLRRGVVRMRHASVLDGVHAIFRRCRIRVMFRDCWR